MLLVKLIFRTICIRLLTCFGRRRKGGLEFDASWFDEYREGNRPEAKKAKDMTMFIMYRLVMTG